MVVGDIAYAAARSILSKAVGYVPADSVEGVSAMSVRSVPSEPVRNVSAAAVRSNLFMIQKHDKVK